MPESIYGHFGAIEGYCKRTWHKTVKVASRASMFTDAFWDTQTRKHSLLYLKKAKIIVDYNIIVCYNGLIRGEQSA